MPKPADREGPLAQCAWTLGNDLRHAAPHSLPGPAKPPIKKVRQMNWKLSHTLPGSSLALFLPGLAEAHTFGAVGGSLVEGFAHPFLGLDHLLAMLAIGFWAGQQGGRAIWLIPVTFLFGLSVAGFVGMSGIELPLLEPAIAVSLVVLGLFTALSVRLSTLSGLGLVGLFAIFHGYAHGLELPETASATLYATGFVTASALLHVLGLGLAGFSRSSHRLARVAGSLVAGAGVFLLTGF